MRQTPIAHDATGQPGLVSIVIPAHNAAATLAKTIASVQAQTYGDWEALLIDDGSTDQTLAIAQNLAAQDTRLRVHSQAQGGESAARNAGLEAAHGEAVVFLDADDWLLPRYLERMLPALQADPSLAVVYCGHFLATPDGRHGPGAFPWWSSDLFEELCCRNPFAIHSCLARRSLVSAVGGFDSGLRTAPDWDFWQRAARMGARFGKVHEVLAGYLVRPGSATSQARQILLDGLTIIERGHQADPRVPHADPRYAAGRSPAGLPLARLQYACWPAGLAIGQGQDARPLLAELPETGACELSPRRVAEALFDAVPWPSGLLKSDVYTLWPQVTARIDDFLAALEARSQTPGLAQQARDALRLMVYGAGPAEAGAASAAGAEALARRVADLERANAWLAQQVENWHTATVERDQQIQGLKAWITELEAGKAWLDEQRLSWRRTAEERETQLRQLTRQPWRRWLRSTARPEPPPAAPPAVPPIPAAPAAAEPPPAAPAPSTGPFASPRQVEQVSRAWGFDRGQPVDRHYIEAFLARCAGDVRGRVLEIGDNSYTRRFGGERVTHSDVLNVAAGHPQTTIVADLGQPGALPEGVFDCILLTQTLHLIFDTRAALQTLARGLKPGGVLLLTCPGLTRTSQTEWPGTWYWRFTPPSLNRLLAEALPDLEVEVESHGNVLAASAFLYGLAVEDLTTAELEHHDPEYDVILTVRAVKRGGTAVQAARTAAASAPARENQALILLYHRVAEAEVDPWSMAVSPKHFAEQLQVLQRDYQPVRLSELRQALTQGPHERPLAAVTFDDGYADNLHAALPILEAHEVPATFFIVTGAVDARTEFWWDTLERLLLWPGTLPRRLAVTIEGQPYAWALEQWAEYSPTAAAEQRGWQEWMTPPTPRHQVFLDLWEQLRPLPAEARQRVLDDLIVQAGPGAGPRQRSLGLDELLSLAQSRLADFGAHTVTHASLAALPLADQQREIEASRHWLAETLQRPVRAFSYPFGKPTDYGPETAALVRAAGFDCACVNTSGSVGLASDPFQWPRLFVVNQAGAEFEAALWRALAG